MKTFLFAVAALALAAGALAQNPPVDPAVTAAPLSNEPPENPGKAIVQRGLYVGTRAAETACSVSQTGHQKAPDLPITPATTGVNDERR